MSTEPTRQNEFRLNHAHDPISMSYLREIDAALKKAEPREDVGRANAIDVPHLEAVPTKSPASTDRREAAEADGLEFGIINAEIGAPSLAAT
jgi:hypothetical protein